MKIAAMALAIALLPIVTVCIIACVDEAARKVLR